MTINLALPEPFALDLLHVLLAGLAAVLFVVLLLVAKRSSAAAGAAAKPPVESASVEPAPVVNTSLKELSPDAALQLLSLLQQEARLIDFLNEDLTGFSDSDIGAVARVVHEGGVKVLKTYFEIEPVRQESEESIIEVPPGFDAQRVRLTGNVSGEPPYRGTLTHRGWQINQVKLPQLAKGHQTQIIAPAEVEI